MENALDDIALPASAVCRTTIAVLAGQMMAQLELRRAVADLATRTEMVRARESRPRTVFETTDPSASRRADGGEEAADLGCEMLGLA